MYFRCRGYHYYEGFVDYIKRLPLAPHCCRSAPHQLPLATAVCSIGQTPQNFNKKLKRGTVSSEEMLAIAKALDVGYEQVFVLPE